MNLPDFSLREDCERLLSAISSLSQRSKRKIRIMEVCGTHTMNFFRYGLKDLFPENLEVISGPGCPVCVTSDSELDMLISASSLPNVIAATFGDMMRVPGTNSSLECEKALGADIRIIYSPEELLNIAVAEPLKTVLFSGVGFETTAPLTAALIAEASRRKISNMKVFLFHKRILPAMEALLQEGPSRIDGFLCPGNVSVITGWKIYEPIAEIYKKPCVVAGFEPVDLLLGLFLLLRQIVEGRALVENEYARAVTPEGNLKCQEEMEAVFSLTDASWRGLGVIPRSGFTFLPEFHSFDARALISKVSLPPLRQKNQCKCAEILKGMLSPEECPLFSRGCTPESPLGPCMVSSEGSCAIHYRFRKKYG
jgi:hydrogenase expression/formation protein HypD